MENPETHAILDTRYKTKKPHNTKKKDEQHWPHQQTGCEPRVS